MSLIHAAIYARVSSDQHAAAHTIASQVAALRERGALDGLALSMGWCYQIPCSVWMQATGAPR